MSLSRMCWMCSRYMLPRAVSGTFFIWCLRRSSDRPLQDAGRQYFGQMGAIVGRRGEIGDELLTAAAEAACRR